MPAGDDTEQPQRRQLLTVLFWVGVGLAPLAALMLLFGQGNGPLRIAAVLAVVAVVLIGLSITLRADMQTVRSDLEESLLGEIEELRGTLRKDISTAARATHQSVGEQLQVVQQNVEALRRQLDGRTDGVPGRAGVPEPVAVPAGVAHAAAGRPASGPVEPDHREPARDGTYGTPARPAPERVASGPTGREPGPEPGDYGRADHRRPEGTGPYGSPQRGPTPYGGPTQYGDRQYGGGQFPAGEPEPGYGGDRGGRGAATPPGAVPPPHRPHLAGGVVRHTETVKVTTRQTIVGPPGDDAGAGSVYGGGTGYGSGPAYSSGGGYARDDAGYPPGNVYGGRGDDREDDWAEQPARGRRAAGPDGDSWSQRWPREDRGDGAGRRGGSRYEPEEPDDVGYEGDPHWSGRAGDRWASVRRDERGSEMRMGERRAAVRADDSGTELRVEDRWASMRRDEPRRADSRRDEPGGAGHRAADDRAPGGRRRAEEWPRSDDAHRPGPGTSGDAYRPGPGGSGDAYRPGPGASGDAHWPGQDAGAWADGGQDRWGGAPALPAGGAGPSAARRGNRDEPGRDPAGPGRRRAEEPAYGYPPDDDAPRAGGARWR